MKTHRTSISALRRRQLITAMGLGLAGGVMVPRTLLAGEAAPQKLMRTFPSSGVQVPAVGLGTARTFSLVSLPTQRSVAVDSLDVSEEQVAPLREVLRVFYAEGGRLVDSSPMYGAAEDVIGRLAADLGLVDQFFMSTKVWADGREAGEQQMRRSMELLRRKPMDAMLIHNLRDWRTQYRTLRDWQEQGLIRHIGVSHSRTEAHGEVERVLKAERFDVLQINYNAVDTSADQRLLPLCQDRGLATEINVPFGNGRLFGVTRGKAVPEWAAEFDAESWAQVFLKFIISHPAVTCAIPATSKAKHARDNTRAMLGRMPDEKQRQQIVRHLAALA